MITEYFLQEFMSAYKDSDDHLIKLRDEWRQYHESFIRCMMNGQTSEQAVISCAAYRSAISEILEQLKVLDDKTQKLYAIMKHDLGIDKLP